MQQAFIYKIHIKWKLQMFIKDKDEDTKAELHINYLYQSYLKIPFLFLIQLPYCLPCFSSFPLKKQIKCFKLCVSCTYYKACQKAHPQEKSSPGALPIEDTSSNTHPTASWWRMSVFVASIPFEIFCLWDGPCRIHLWFRSFFSLMLIQGEPGQSFS